MHLGHLRDVDFDWLGHYLWEVKRRERRDVETIKGLGLTVFFWVEAALKLDHRDGRILDELDFANPATVLVFSELFVHLIQQ